MLGIAEIFVGMLFAVGVLELIRAGRPLWQQDHTTKTDCISFLYTVCGF
jgi:hypothetical protein